MIALANMAPGMNRSFLSESWTTIPKKCWYDAIDEATEMVDDTVKVDIQGYDIDGEVIKAARENGESRVDHDSFPGAPGGAAEPSEEIWLYYHKPALRRAYRGEKNLQLALYKTIGERFKALDSNRCT